MVVPAWVEAIVLASNKIDGFIDAGNVPWAFGVICSMQEALAG